MSRRQAYLCKKVQPGEIERGDLLTKIEKARIMSDAADIVRLGVMRGLMTYPANQTFKPDGTPDPMIHKLKHQPGQWAHWAAIRAFLLSENGSTHEQIAARLRVGIRKVPPMIASGRELHRAKAASEPRKWGKDTIRDLKRASRQGNGGNGHPVGKTNAKTSPRVGILRKSAPIGGAKTDRGARERKLLTV